MRSEVHLLTQITTHKKEISLLMQKHRESIPWGEFCKFLHLPPSVSCTYANHSVAFYFAEQFGSEGEKDGEKTVWNLSSCTVALLIINGIARISVDLYKDSDTTPVDPTQLALF